MFELIKKFLIAQNVDFKTAHHPPTKTSEESALARGEELSIGGKALILKIDDSFRIFVISAANRLNSKAVRKYFGAKKVRFADVDELFEITGLSPGSVPPFGRPLIDLDLFVDASITKNQRIAFNAGSLTDSVIMKTSDYLIVAKPQIFDFSQP